MAPGVGPAPQPMSRTAKIDFHANACAESGRFANLPRRFLYSVIGCCLLIASSIGVIVYEEYQQQLRHWQEKLIRIADANQRLLENWVNERNEDAHILSSTCAGITSQKNPGRQLMVTPACGKKLRPALLSTTRSYGYAGAYLLDREGHVLVESEGSTHLTADVLKEIAARSGPGAVTLPAPTDHAGYSPVAFFAPIRYHSPGALRATPTVGHVVLLTRPGAVTPWLFADAGPTATGETILLALQANQPAFISPLRHWKLGTRWPKPPPGTPGRITLVEKRQLFGLYQDYRGVPVLAATRYVPELGWAMVTKVDRKEALMAFRKTLILSIAISLLSLFTIISIAAAWLRHGRILRLQTELARERETEENLRRSEERFWVALQNSPVVVFNQDRELRYTWINQPAPPWSETNYRGKTDEEIIGMADGSRLSALKRLVLDTGIGSRKEWSFVWQGELRAYDINIQPLRNEAGEVVGITCASTDVTERKRAEEHLREYEKVVEGLEEMIVVVDRNYHYLIANRAYLEYRGLQPEQLIGRQVGDVLNPGVFEHELKRRMDKCFEGEIVIFEMKYTYPKLGERDLLISFLPIEGTNGVDRLACVLQDITDRKRAEKALRDSETRYRLLFERNPAGVYRCTLDGKLLDVNDAFARIFGYSSRDDLLKYPITHFYFRPEERPSLLDSLREQSCLMEHEFCGRHRDGTPLWVLSNMAFVAGENGAPDILEGTFIDVTARKSAEDALQHSEAQLRAFIGNAPYGIFRCAGKSFLSANPALVKMLGYTSEAELLNLNLDDDVFYPRGKRLDLPASSAQQGEFGPVEVSWKRRDGALTLMRLRGRVSGASNGEHTIEAIAEDITQQRALEEYLSQSDRLEALGRLASSVAHDFNNLLLGITLNLEHVLQRSPGCGNLVREEIEQALHAARNAAAVTRQLLVFGRKRALQRQSVNLNDVVIRSQDLVNRLAGENIHVNLRLSPNLDPVQADPVQVQQVILNLVANARDAMADGGQITVATRTIELQEVPPEEYFAAVPKAGTYVLLEVSDTGSGISREALTRIFEPFYTTKVEGSGLGLSTSYGIVAQSSGYISVRTQPGQGTTVRSYLPRQHEVPPTS